MPKHFLTTILMCLCLLVSAQKKKELKKYGIRGITVTETVGTKTITDSKCTYDANGLLLQEINYNKDGLLKSTTNYKYSKTGDVIEELEYDEKNALKEKRTFKYNAMGDKSEELVLDANGKQIKKMVYVYDARGLKTEKRTYDADNNLVSVKKTMYSTK